MSHSSDGQRHLTAVTCSEGDAKLKYVLGCIGGNDTLNEEGTRLAPEI